MADETPTAKETAAQHMKEALKRVQEARAKASDKDSTVTSKSGKGAKSTVAKGRMFRHQGR